MFVLVQMQQVTYWLPPLFTLRSVWVVKL